MHIRIVRKALFFLSITLFQPLYSSNQLQDYLLLPQRKGAPIPLSFDTHLINTPLSLEQCLAVHANGELLIIHARKGNSETEIDYFYGAPPEEIDLSLVATYEIKQILRDGRLVPVATNSSLKKTVFTLDPTAKAFCPTFSLPSTPALLVQMLSYRKSALIETFQKHESPDRTNYQWEKILRQLCNDSGYSFCNLDLSYPTAEEIRSTPPAVPYTTEKSIKKMKEELAAESTAEKRRQELLEGIETLEQFIRDFNTPQPLAHDGTRLAPPVLHTLPALPPAPVIPHTPPIIKAAPTDQHVAPARTLTIPSPVLPATDPLPSTSSANQAKTVSISLPTPRSINAPTPAKPIPPLQPICHSTSDKTVVVPLRAALPVATVPKSKIARSKEDFFEQCAAAATTSSVPPVRIQKEESNKPSKFEKEAAAAEEYRLKKLKKEQEKAAMRSAKTKQEKDSQEETSPTPSTEAPKSPAPSSSDPFATLFATFHKEVKATYSRPKSKAETEALIREFFLKRITSSSQIFFSFEQLVHESGLAIFYETLSRLMNEQELSTFSKEQFKVLSQFVAHSLAAQLRSLEGDTHPGIERARSYLRDFQIVAQANAIRTITPSESTTASCNPFTAPLHHIFMSLTALHDEFRDKLKTATGARKRVTEVLLKRNKEEINGTILTLIQAVRTEKDLNNFLMALKENEKSAAYGDVRALIDSSIQAGNPDHQSLWRLYKILPDPRAFSSVAACAIPGSFAIRCKVFQEELTRYLATAPLEEAVFEAVETLIVRFLRTADTQAETDLFLHKLESEEIFCFCIGGLFTHLQRSATANPIITVGLCHQFEQYLTEHIHTLRTNPTRAPLVTHLEKVLAKVRLVITTHLSPGSH